MQLKLCKNQGVITVFYYWVSKNLFKLKEKKKILSLGGVKIADAIISLKHEIYSLVLEFPLDTISNVKYIKCDVCANILPLPNNYFDIFISPATLHLIGLGRYHDKKILFAC